uniref:SH3 domain-containing protein n=1 Tax=Anabas testudineus TaxID=64144 RepID=A0A7N6A0Y4_ANATE
LYSRLSRLELKHHNTSLCLTVSVSYVPQMQCIRAFVAQQPDELSLDKADIILVHQKSSDHWVEGTRLPDCHRGWVPESNLETIGNPIVRQSNLLDALKLTTATAAV